uniref:Uncharacterized protein n=1 Tax=Cannabis sativa TaxID=3483 RepID=A0A803Q2A6_CANSA
MVLSTRKTSFEEDVKVPRGEVNQPHSEGTIVPPQPHGEGTSQRREKRPMPPIPEDEGQVQDCESSSSPSRERPPVRGQHIVDHNKRRHQGAHLLKQITLCQNQTTLTPYFEPYSEQPPLSPHHPQQQTTVSFAEVSG